MTDHAKTGAPQPPAAGSRQKVVGRALHAGRFIACGTLAFLVDAAVLASLTRGLAIDPFLSRLVAISIAMLVGWQAHRKITFSVDQRSSTREFAAYASVAWVAAAANYAIYAGILVARPQTPPLLSLVFASLIAMILSYSGMRYGVFGRPGSTAPPPR